ncbi:hypothetical protein HZA96_01800 [Candidatus Woesearchaeota archaeon]|nr:hypothetical protein [Candidatus Woesearchaeota archaeon]
MTQKSKGGGFLQVIDGLLSNKSREAFAENEFTAVLYEIQQRRKERIVSRKYYLIDDNEEKKSLLEKMLCHYPDNLCVKLSAVIAYFDDKNLKHLGLLVLREIEEAIAMDSQLLSKLNNEESFVDKLRDNNLDEAELRIARHYLDIKRLQILKSDSQSLYDLLIKSYAAVLMRDNNTALSCFRAIEKIHPEAIFAYNLYARRLEASNYKKEAEEKRSIFSSWALHDNNTQFERISNAMRSVYELNNEAAPAVNKTLISIRTKSKDEISYEQSAISKAKEIVQNYDCYKIVESVHTECIDGSYYHILRRKSGDLLLSFLEDKCNSDKQLSVLLDTSSFLQLLQFNMDKATICSEKECDSLAMRLSARFDENDLKLSENDKNSIAEICRSFLFLPVVYNKDSHPENWIVERLHGSRTGYIITALDFQRKEAVPCVFDIANLLRYGDYIKDKDELAVLREYYQQRSNKSNDFKNINYQQFVEGYYAAVVYRMFSLFCAWKHPRKAGYNSRVPIILHNAVDAIEKIQKIQDKQFNAERILHFCKILQKD